MSKNDDDACHWVRVRSGGIDRTFVASRRTLRRLSSTATHCLNHPSHTVDWLTADVTVELKQCGKRERLPDWVAAALPHSTHVVLELCFVDRVHWARTAEIGPIVIPRALYERALVLDNAILRDQHRTRYDEDFDLATFTDDYWLFSQVVVMRDDVAHVLGARRAISSHMFEQWGPRNKHRWLRDVLLL